MSDQPEPQQPRRRLPKPPTYASGVTHAAVQEREAAEAADVARGEAEYRRVSRERAWARINREVPEGLRGTIGVDRDGGVTQSFASAAAAGDCGCSNPADFSSISAPTVVELIPMAPRQPQQLSLTDPLNSNRAPSAASPLTRGGRLTTDDLARQLADRVSRVRNQFAARTAQPVVVFDQAGRVVGTIDPKKVTVPDGVKVIAAFNQGGEFVGLVNGKDLTKVAEGEPVGTPSSGVAVQQAPEQVRQPQMPLTKGQIGGQLSTNGTAYSEYARRWWA